jgi:serralysin
VSGNYTLELDATSFPLPNGTTGASTGTYNVTYGRAAALIGIVDTSTGKTLSSVPTIAVSNSNPHLTSEFITVNQDNLSIASSGPGEYLATGSGNDAINASGDYDVLDGGAGSNFLVGTGQYDSFFADARSAPVDTWDTIAGFHPGDFATIWGVTPQQFALNWADGMGAPGYTGLTLIATSPGKPNVALTLSGFSTADLSNGRLSVGFWLRQRYLHVCPRQLGFKR